MATVDQDHHGKLHAMYGHRNALRATGHKLFFYVRVGGGVSLRPFAGILLLLMFFKQACYHSNHLKETVNVQSIHFIVQLFLNDSSLINIHRPHSCHFPPMKHSAHGLTQEVLKRLFKPKEKYFKLAPSEGSLYISS